MRQGGHINSLSMTQFAGNVKLAELTRFIPKTILNLTACLVGYDPGRQKVYFFVAGKVLALFKDLIDSGKSPWSVYTTIDSSNFATNAVKYMYLPATTMGSVCWGDSVGRVFAMDGTGNGDAGSSNISVLFQTKIIDDTVISPWPYHDEILYGEVRYRRNGAFNLTLSFDWGDEFNVTSSILPLKGPPPNDVAAYFNDGVYFGGNVYFNQGFAFSKKISSYSFEPIGKGPEFFLSLSASTSVVFKVDEVCLY